MMRPSRLALLAFLLAAPAHADLYFQVPLGASPARGGATPKVTIVAFAGFPCPYSGRATPVMRALLAEFPSELRYVFKHRPLFFMEGGVPAARAAIAAGEQGKFWEMHDRLFANPRALDRADFEQHARALGLDLGRFAAAQAGAAPASLAEDEALAERLGARGTPTFFINGRLVTGARPIGDFRRIIKEELARADAALAKGIPLADLYGELTKDGLERAPPRHPYPRPARAPQPSAELPLDVPVTSDDACKGAPDPLVTLVAFVGFQCPFSARLWPVLQQLLSRYPGTLRVCIKHSPLPFHKDAEPAAQAAIEAQRQGNFWDYADLLFANQRALSGNDLQAYASKVGLDPAAIANAVATSKHGAAMVEHRALAERLTAVGTPTAFINGLKLVGAQPLERFTAMIDEASFRAEILVRAGVPRTRIYDVLRQLAAPVPKGANHP